MEKDKLLEELSHLSGRKITPSMRKTSIEVIRFMVQQAKELNELRSKAPAAKKV